MYNVMYSEHYFFRHKTAIQYKLVHYTVFEQKQNHVNIMNRTVLIMQTLHI